MKCLALIHHQMTRMARAKLAAAVLLLVIPALGLYAGFYLEKEGLLPTLLGRQRSSKPVNKELAGAPVSNRMDGVFADADGNLIADPPKPRDQINPVRLILAVSGFESELVSEKWSPFLEHLAKAADRPVQLELATFADQYKLRSMRDGEVHLAIIGAGTVPMAVNTGGFVPVAKLPTSDGTGRTHMQLIVPAASTVISPFQLSDAEFLFVDPHSNAGCKAAVVFLRSDFSLRPGREYTWRFSGSPRESIRQIAQRQAIVAAVAADALRDEVAAGSIRADQYRVIYESESFPTAAIGYTHLLKVELAEKLRKAILSFDWKGTSLEPLLGSKRTQFLPVDFRNDWSLVRRIDDATGTLHALP